MTEMRTRSEQIEGLKLLQHRLQEKGHRSRIAYALGDVVALQIDGDHDREVVYAVDGYDGWEQQLVKTDMDLAEAVAWALSLPPERANDR
jgi:hypothetical protein